MWTEHRWISGDSREVDLPESDLIVTSPPYPMVEMWDDILMEWTGTDPQSDPGSFFRKSHRQLERVWEQCIHSLSDGGTLCINIGDATRTEDDYQIWPNRDRIVESLSGLRLIGEIVWKKPSRSPSPFMGSGTAPPNQYVTLDHEHILIFRKGENPDSEPESSYFWTERNRWFTDIWDISGAQQSGDGPRDVTAAYPRLVPLRLVSMYSQTGDTVLDPFAGTGTTAQAAAISGRNSVSVDIEDEYHDVWDRRLERVPELGTDWIQRRIRYYLEDIKEQTPKYRNEELDLPVMTKQERSMKLWEPERRDGGRVAYSQFGPVENGFDLFR